MLPAQLLQLTQPETRGLCVRRGITAHQSRTSLYNAQREPTRSALGQEDRPRTHPTAFRAGLEGIMTCQLKRAAPSVVPLPQLTKVEPLPALVKEHLEGSSSPLVAAFASLATGPRTMEILKLIQLLTAS